MKKNYKKYWLSAAVLLLALVAAFFSIKKFHLSSPAPTARQKTEPAEAVPGETFIEAVPITFKVEKYMEIQLPDGDAFDPRVSPDGSRIVFIKRTKGKNTIAVADLTGKKTLPLSLGLDDYMDPSWNVDGTKIVFAGVKGGMAEIYLYDLNGGKLRRVTNDQHRKKSRPRFSPYRFDDNYRIAYVSEEKGRKDIWWVRESGEFDHPITVPVERTADFKKSPYWKHVDLSPPDFVNKGGDSPEWSPSGNTIIYRTGRNKYAALAYGYQEWWHKAMIPLPATPGLLSWSPNQMSFLDYDPANGRSSIISREGLKKKAILDNKPLSSSPAWFPDGKGFAYTYRKDGRSILAMEPFDDPLGDVANLWMYSYNRSQQDKLTRNQILFFNANYEQIYTLYDSELYADEEHVYAEPYLVTSDAILETFYAAFSALLSYTERGDFTRSLKEFAANGAKVAGEKKVDGEVQRFFLTGLALIDPAAGKTMPREVRKEVARIEQAEGEATSLFDKKVTYGDFFIRGKYERDKNLQGYFRSLKWFQTFKFDLKKEKEKKWVAEILRVTTSPKVYPPLARINQSINEIIGESRYYGPLTLKELPQVGALPAVQSSLPWIQIQETFRLFPSIYTLDAFIFDELVTHLDRPNTVGTAEDPRLLPVGMDIMATLGSDEAKRIVLDEFKERRFVNYQKRLDEVTARIRRFPPNVWDRNIYQNWLGTLATLLRDPEAKSPAFTRTKAWKRKQLNTALGSWVNLRYETIAYVEQVSAEAGEGGYEQLNVGMPRGYVEPNPEFFRKLDDGFARIAKSFAQSIMDPELKKAVMERIVEYRRHLQSLERIARKELDNVPRTDEEYREILEIGRTIEHFILIMNSMGGREDEGALKIPDSIRKIVDVQKDPGNVKLYEALGFVNEINVAVPYYGRRQIVKGPVYSYYELHSPEQLNSEKWRASGLPRHPAWIEPYYAGKSRGRLQGPSPVK
jgi:hypothetical protein